ncbi:MAG TPA: hypothetical protein VFW07_13715 [Parafilimonas sp.]|nr:hypothetical protein [Parafilimonas sp.]
MKAQICLSVAILLLSCNNTDSVSQKETNNDTASVSAPADSSISVLRNDSMALNTQNNIEANKTIIPGESIGKAVLNTDAANLETEFGKPDMSDAAMGKAWLTWYGKKDEHNNKTELNIYTTYKDTSMQEKTVQQIRTTSSFFSTENNVRVYSSLNEIKKAFPAIQNLNKLQGSNRNIFLYDDVQNGIAFEIADANDQKICTAITVHIKGKKVADIYIPTPSP